MYPNQLEQQWAAISESVIDGLTSVNAPGYTDTFGTVLLVCSHIVGPTPLDIEDRSILLA